MRRAAALGIACRAMTDDDLPFVAALFASVRAAELMTDGWPDAMKAAFLDQQHRAQHQQYRARYPDGEWLVVERNGIPVGRLYIDDAPAGLHLIDISLMEAARGDGIGTAILEDLIEHAESAGRPMSLSVTPDNPARRLYLRLGFVGDGRGGAYEPMRRPPRGHR